MEAKESSWHGGVFLSPGYYDDAVSDSLVFLARESGAISYYYSEVYGANYELK